ncbi:MAG TPA: penicillin-binding transpeptidase domain-containing protein, partial [Acidimicrobiia bacterium]|nr:penicillin-binding transpeptidase domain-containing protein [Acidimicrobiia bacterium]
LDPKLQDAAAKAIVDGVGATDRNAALAAVEPQTGFVRALVGGKDWNLLKVNLAVGRSLLGQSGTGRQPGSSFKPFVLAQALEEGFTPSKVYPAPSCVAIGDWRPCNYGGSGYGSASLARATHSSINTVYAQLIRDVGAKDTAALAQRLGVEIDPENPRADITIGLGTWETSPLEMASAYSVFAARGMKAEPTPVLRVTDRDGNVLIDNTQPKRTRVLREVIADTMNDVMRGVITSGTARNANINRPAAGKTGTSSDSADAWFVGYTPALSTAVWMGHPEGRVAMPNETGGNVPAKMWAAFMKVALADVEPTDFNDPAPLDSLRDRARRQQRGGFDLGDRKWPSGLDGDAPKYQPPIRPEAAPPPEIEPTTTTTTRPRLITTTTTDPDSTTSTTSNIPL